MKKAIKVLLALILLLNSVPVSALTITGKSTDSGTNIRNGASTKHSVIGTSKFGDVYNIIDVIPSENISACASDWYKFEYNGEYGYICGDYVALYLDNSDEVISEDLSDEEKTSLEEKKKYEEELRTLGFPESYIPYLSLLHEKHPTWEFEPLITGIKFDDAVTKESALGVSLIQDDYTYDGWKTTESPGYDYGTDTWKSYDSGNWVAANKEAVAYFLDPRNFLTDSRIFQFEKLKYDASYQTLEAVQGIFGSGTLFYNHANAFIEAGSTYDVNSVYLASKVKLEVGANGSGSTSGGAFTYNGVTYNGGIYNVYNIGAYRTSAGSAVDRGLYWAMGGFGLGNPDKYLRPWSSLDLSIKGGALWIAEGYINAGQYTTYLQRFNVAKGYVGTSHQYQTDLRAPYHASTSSYQSYYKNGLAETTFKFTIPVYDEMPEFTFLPDIGNPNNHLKELKVNNTLVNNFDHETFEYTFYVRSGATSVEVSATTINKNATLAGVGTIMLTGDTTKSVIEVTAENGAKENYTINIVKTGTIAMTPDEIIDASSLKKTDNFISGISLGATVESLSSLLTETCPGASISMTNSDGAIKTTGLIGTGDTLTITNGEISNTYNIVIYGDVSGDGEITVLDLLKVQKHILGYTLLNGAFNKAADASHDNEITVLDLLKVQKHILGYTSITQ